MARGASEVNNVNQWKDRVNVFVTEKEMIYLKSMKFCASRNKEYWFEVFQKPLVVPHFSKGTGRKLKSVTLLKQYSTTGIFVFFLKIFRTFFYRTPEGGLFYLFEITFGRVVAQVSLSH